MLKSTYSLPASLYIYESGKQVKTINKLSIRQIDEITTKYNDEYEMVNDLIKRKIKGKIRVEVIMGKTSVEVMYKTDKEILINNDCIKQLIFENNEKNAFDFLIHPDTAFFARNSSEYNKNLKLIDKKWKQLTTLKNKLYVVNEEIYSFASSEGKAGIVERQSMIDELEKEKENIKDEIINIAFNVYDNIILNSKSDDKKYRFIRNLYSKFLRKDNKLNNFNKKNKEMKKLKKEEEKIIQDHLKEEEKNYEALKEYGISNTCESTEEFLEPKDYREKNIFVYCFTNENKNIEIEVEYNFNKYCGTLEEMKDLFKENDAVLDEIDYAYTKYNFEKSKTKKR